MSALTKIATALALLLGLGAQAAEGEAQEEKVLRLYNWSDYFAPDTLSEFTRETGIRVIYDVMDSSETLEAKLMAGRSGYDLIFPGDTVAERLMRAGSLQSLDKGKLQHLRDIDPGLARLQQAYPHAKEAVVPYTWGTIGLTYNADAIKQRMPDAPVSSLDMLFKPELAAKFADCGISVIDSPQRQGGRSGGGPAQGDQALYPQVPVPAGNPAGERGSLPLPGLQRRHDPGQARRRRGGQAGRLRIPIAEGGEHHLDGHHGDPGGCPPS